MDLFRCPLPDGGTDSRLFVRVRVRVGSGSGRSTSAGPRLPGAVVTHTEQSDRNFEQGPRARLEMTVPLIPSLACRAVINAYLTAGYYVEGAIGYDTDGRMLDNGRVGPITDSQAWCAMQDNRVSDVRAYPPNRPRKDPSDGFSTVIKPADGNPDHPKTSLWLQAP